MADLAKSIATPAPPPGSRDENDDEIYVFVLISALSFWFVTIELPRAIMAILGIH